MENSFLKGSKNLVSVFLVFNLIYLICFLIGRIENNSSFLLIFISLITSFCVLISIGYFLFIQDQKFSENKGEKYVVNYFKRDIFCDILVFLSVNIFLFTQAHYFHEISRYLDIKLCLFLAFIWAAISVVIRNIFGFISTSLALVLSRLLGVTEVVLVSFIFYYLVFS